MKRLRRRGAESRSRIIMAGVEVAEVVGYRNVNRAHICAKLGISASLITKHVGTLVQLHEAIIREGVAQESIPIITQLALDRHPYVAGGISAATQQKVIAHLFPA